MSWARPGHVDEVGIAAQPDRHAAADLGDLQRVGEPGARRLALPWPDHLGLVGQPAQGGAVQDPRPVAGEIGAVFGVGARAARHPWAVRPPDAAGRTRRRGLRVAVTDAQSARTDRRSAAPAASDYIDGHAHRPSAQPLLAILTAGTAVAPARAAEPPLRLPDHVTDNAGALSHRQLAEVSKAVDKLYNDRRIRLWVVYVNTFSGQDARRRGPEHHAASAISATRTRCWRSRPQDRAYAFRCLRRHRRQVGSTSDIRAQLDRTRAAPR